VWVSITLITLGIRSRNCAATNNSNNKTISFFFFFYFRQSTVSLQRSKIHADKKTKGCLDCHHLWSVENLKAIYSSGDTCITGIKILATSCFPEMVVASYAARQ